MPDPRLFDSSSLTSPPEPRVEAATCNAEIPDRRLLNMFPYEGPSVPPMETPFQSMTLNRYRVGW
jgi:hypothetical protein